MSTEQLSGPLAGSLKGRFHHIAGARELSCTRIDQARQRLSSLPSDELDVVAFGSLARLEVTAESDFDYLVLAAGVPATPTAATDLLRAADELRATWAQEEGREGSEVSPPGATNIFGRTVGAFELVDQIGLQEDTNHSTTRRMLLIEESVSLRNGHVHERVLRSALDRYLLVGPTSDDKVPRFLLNDVVRYWRTITVDYQAKVRQDQSVSGLRYVKLLIPRKILYAGTLMSLMLCGKEGRHSATVDDLYCQFTMPPIDRLVQAYDDAPGSIQDAMEQVLACIDHYLELSADRAWRDDVKKSWKGSTEPCVAFDEIRQHAAELQASLESIFFDWDLLASDARKMLVF
ncbi:hypothetical protein [Nocardioides sp.]|uniref:hypothetical protein n=1 Tax=Nocardioides sp. TaxID=35761 RepID=UPI002ED84267